jgi:hypothetical protein
VHISPSKKRRQDLSDLLPFVEKAKAARETFFWKTAPVGDLR